MGPRVKDDIKDVESIRLEKRYRKYTIMNTELESITLMFRDCGLAKSKKAKSKSKSKTKRGKRKEEAE